MAIGLEYSFAVTKSESGGQQFHDFFSFADFRKLLLINHGWCSDTSNYIYQWWFCHFVRFLLYCLLQKINVKIDNTPNHLFKSLPHPSNVRRYLGETKTILSAARLDPPSQQQAAWLSLLRTYRDGPTTRWHCGRKGRKIRCTPAFLNHAWRLVKKSGKSN